MANETVKTERRGIISLRTEGGWTPWGIGTFREGLEAKAEAGATGMAYCPLTPRTRKAKEAA